MISFQIKKHFQHLFVFLFSVILNLNKYFSIQQNYFKRISDLNLKNPQIVGFGISNNETFNQATKYGKGAIIGSAFVKHVTTEGINTIDKFVHSILN